MKVKKIEGILLGLGLGFAVVGIALFFIVPLIAGANFQYNSIGILTSVFKKFAGFDFKTLSFIVMFVVLCVIVIFDLVWIIGICVRRKPLHLISALGMLIAGVIVLVFLSAYVLVETKIVDGGETGKLITLIIKSDGRLGKSLSVLAMSLIHGSVICLGLFSFIDLFEVYKSEDIKKVEEAPVSEEAPVEEAAAPIEEAPIREVVNETVAEEVVLVQENPLDGLEDRKAREEAFYDSCLATGEFEEYDEVELDNPIQSYEDEPVFELTEVEEEDEKILRHNYVQVSTKSTVSIK